jgi:hypothetical protein
VRNSAAGAWNSAPGLEFLNPGARTVDEGCRAAFLGSPPWLAGQALPRRLLAPIRPGVRTDDSAPGAHHARPERGHRHVVGPGVRAHDRSVVAQRARYVERPHAVGSAWDRGRVLLDTLGGRGHLDAPCPQKRAQTFPEGAGAFERTRSLEIVVQTVLISISVWLARVIWLWRTEERARKQQ